MEGQSRAEAEERENLTTVGEGERDEELGLRLGLASAGASVVAGEPPSVGMEFPSSEAAREFYCAYADRAGFAVRTDKSRRSRRDDSVIMRRFVCTREGFHPTRHDDLTEAEAAAAGKRRRKRLIIREGCMAMCEVTKREPPLRWVVTKFVAHHVHPVSLPVSSRPPPTGASGGIAGEHVGALDESTRAAAEPLDEPTGAPAAVGNGGPSFCNRLVRANPAGHANLKADLKECVFGAETIEEFQARWDYVIHKYNLQENVWLQSLYDSRQQWAWVYQKGSFFPELLKSQRSERLNKFFKTHFNMKTPLIVLISRFDQVMMLSFEKEAQANSVTVYSKPTLKTPSVVERQAANIYTRAVFDLFQEEFIESLGYHADKIEDGVILKYNVAREEENGRSYIVSFNQLDRKAECTIIDSY
ncbi:hypothetical protein E2562_029087 [Oryza meyeriana var. granulata]|uniref:Protein FAR1-RELATED SEQUENCE n=1 Tax=Oryza meyeriana var. granulata TaxID=110450 RepID=A0A6G1CTC7_9ORYZ|nr:hypothetical protein E2562_029087 [Oryza meyeriana var. granulata]